ncbi:MAG: response regulator transcription factor [Holosporales bacterium]|jgi:two-component system KDP operon response regulator KdpE
MHEKKNTILVVDDAPEIQKMLSILLGMENFKVVESTSGQQAIRQTISSKPELILLDLGLPDMDGKAVITAIREWSQVPIIVLSAQSGDAHIVEALNLGASDYVTKPFNIDVLLARINAALRSAAVHEVGEPVLCNGGLRMDLVRHEVFLGNERLAFTPKEYELLRYFMVNCGKMLLHKDILKTVWGAAHGEDIAYIRVYVGQIREKIERDASSPAYIKTEPGIGYRMENHKIIAKAA